ncbi:MAG: hypothetical protein JWO38_889, partial [Gemmataceae bacterium]|nr:hypothetical protein [Gemmataceae bacterium]
MTAENRVPSSPLNISDLLGDPDGFPYPPWDVVAARVQILPPDGHSAVWADITRQWLGAVRARIGDSFVVRESDHFQLLVWADEEFSGQLLRHAEYCRRS